MRSTSAPQAVRKRVPVGPATTRVKSRTLIPARARPGPGFHELPFAAPACTSKIGSAATARPAGWAIHSSFVRASATVHFASTSICSSPRPDTSGSPPRARRRPGVFPEPWRAAPAGPRTRLGGESTYRPPSRARPSTGSERTERPRLDRLRTRAAPSKEAWERCGTTRSTGRGPPRSWRARCPRPPAVRPRRPPRRRSSPRRNPSRPTVRAVHPRHESEPGRARPRRRRARARSRRKTRVQSDSQCSLGHVPPSRLRRPPPARLVPSITFRASSLHRESRNRVTCRHPVRVRRPESPDRRRNDWQLPFQGSCQDRDHLRGAKHSP